MADYVFRRTEQKYLLDPQQTAVFQAAMEQNMEPDTYATSAIRNIYYDTPDYRLIRRSLEKPEYKEKLRLRSYGDATAQSKVFLEMKKKYNGVVYKRRIKLRTQAAQQYMADPASRLDAGQIGREIDYFKQFYARLRPAMFLSYDRCSWRSHDGALRITMDRNILYRLDRLDLTEPVGGESLLPPGHTLVEIKSPGSMPLWLVQVLSKNKIRQVSFSKYGNAYRRLLTEHKIESEGFHYV